MALIFSNYGHRWLQQRKHQRATPQETRLLLLQELLDKSVLPSQEVSRYQELLDQGFVQEIEDDIPLGEILLRYLRNPLENIRWIAFEMTTACNFSCLHCRNGSLQAVTERNTERLMDIVDAVIPLEIRRFDFVGGEVTLLGDPWLQLLNHIQRYDHTQAAVITNGWFLEQRDFRVGSHAYSNDIQYMEKMRENGLTHLIFSVDGPQEIHDHWRQHPGLYQRVLRGFEKAREVGLRPRVSLVLTEQLQRKLSASWIQELFDGIYDLEVPSSLPPLAALSAQLNTLIGDSSNYVSNFIDIGRGVTLRQGHFYHIDELTDDLLRCKNFFRPSPSLRIKANGEVSLCPLVDAGDGYGNIHQRSFLDILNRMQEAFVYRLHAEKRIGDYRPFLHTALFGEHFHHPCTLRAILTLIARGMHERQLSNQNSQAIQQLNEEIAARTGFAPS